MIQTEEDYRDGVRELGRLIEREDSLEDAELEQIRILGESLISYERRNVLSATEAFVASVQARADYEATKRGEFRKIDADANLNEANTAPQPAGVRIG